MKRVRAREIARLAYTYLEVCSMHGSEDCPELWLWFVRTRGLHENGLETPVRNTLNTILEEGRE